MTIMITRNDRRMRSIRSLPQGQFVKFLEMFNNSRNENARKANALKNISAPLRCDDITKASNLIYEEIQNLTNESSDQTNEDDKEVEAILGHNNNKNYTNIKSNELTLHFYSNDSSADSSQDLNMRNTSLNSASFTNNISNPMFHGVSDETKNLLTSICSSNEEIATFLGEKNNSQANKSREEKTSHLVNEEEEQEMKVRRYSEYNLYQAIPVTTVDDEFNGLKDLVSYQNGKNLENISYIESTSDSLEEYPEPRNVNINLNEVDFSDDSYDETDEYSSHGYEIKLNVLRLQEKEDECKKK